MAEVYDLFTGMRIDHPPAIPEADLQARIRGAELLELMEKFDLSALEARECIDSMKNQ